MDQVFELLQYQARESVPVDECLEPNNVEVEEEAPYTIVEHEGLNVDFQQDIEVGELSEDLSIIEEISDLSEESVEELLHFLDIVDEISHHKPIEDVHQQRNI